MMFGVLARAFFGSSNDRAVKRLAKTVKDINALESRFAALSDDELRAQTGLFRERLEKGEALDDLLPEAFATVREAAKRVLGMRPFDVQLIGGIVLHQGRISEMKTGEGKTLVATLPVYLNALGGKGVHVVTVNDYLAKRDAEWMGQLYGFLGLSTGIIVHGKSDGDRRVAYAADITYGTNNEFGFDYLRDNMKFRRDEMVQRPFNFAIVDEVDSILIDEARTPLIISGPAQDSSEMYVAVDKLIPALEAGDFEKDEKLRSVTLTETGMERIEQAARNAGLFTSGSFYDAQNVNLVSHVTAALRAHKLFTRDVDYIVKDGKVIIIDEFTGRMMEGRRFSEGLHQALEAREKVRIQQENQTLASITFQNYFRLYPKLAGMTGTALTEAAEFGDIYGLEVVEVPTNVEVTRVDRNDEIYKNREAKYRAIVRQIEECAARGQPVLVGTVSIEKSEMLAAELKKRKIPHHVLNARHHEQEAYIVAQAGLPGAVTIATNMAGRGTDIKLGGNAEMRIQLELATVTDPAERALRATEIEAEVARNRDEVLRAGGLYIIGTERHESRRIDNQLRGRSGRQGDPGESKFFLSLEDDLMRIFGSDRISGMLEKLGLKEDEAIDHPWLNKALEKAQAKVEAQHYDARKNILKFDNVMNDQRKVVYEQRREIMAVDDVTETAESMRQDTIVAVLARNVPENSYPEQWNVSGLHEEIQRVLSLDLPVAEWAKEEGVGPTELLERVRAAHDAHMVRIRSDFDAVAADAAAQGLTLNVPSFVALEKDILLQLLDREWKEHLHMLDHLRQGIGLRAYGQRDPLNEYKREAFTMFESMLDRVREDVTLWLSRVQIRLGSPEAEAAAPQPQAAPAAKPALAGLTPAYLPAEWAATPRNAACPCGSGQKFKYCHGRLD
jgi:preprotein translocase subunit SecA